MEDSDKAKAEVYAEEILLKKLEPELDEDGYDPLDPYAQAAKMVDRKKKEEEAKKSQRFNEFAKKVWDNKDTISYWEKIVKSSCAILGLVYMVVQSGELEKEGVQYWPQQEFWEQFTNVYLWKDFMQREGGICLFFTTAFICASKYNQYLDELEYK